MKKFITILLCLGILFGAVFGVKTIQKRYIGYYQPVALQDGMQVMVKEVAIVEHFRNEYVSVIPDEGEVLLISVVEAYNTSGSDVHTGTYFDQTIEFEDQLYESKLFSVYDGALKNNRKRYLYLISEVPHKVIKGREIRSVDVRFQFGEEARKLRGEIHNEYGFQELIETTYQKISSGQDSFDVYWADDFRGFRNTIAQRVQEKNYQYVFHMIENIQAEYKTQREALEIHLEQMKELNLITPIYPDANLKLITETTWLIHELNAIILTPNTADSKEGVEMFLQTASENLKFAEEQYTADKAELVKLLKSEKRSL